MRLQEPENLPRNCLKIIGVELEFLLILRENPVPAEYYDVKKLKGCADTYRARIGDLRVIYEVLWDLKRVHVLVVEHRERAYS